MHRPASHFGMLFRLLAMAAIVAAALPPAAADPDTDSSPGSVARDLLGDPLPDGALLRLGTTRLRHRNASAVAFSPDGRILASGSRDSIRLWDTETGKQTVEIPHAAVSLAFSPDGKYLAIGGRGGEVRLVSIADRKRVSRDLLSGVGGRHSVSAVAFFPDGRTLASAGGDGDILLWDVSTGKEAHVLRHGWQRRSGFNPRLRMAVSPDGRFIASANGKNIRVWNAEKAYEMAWLHRSDGGDITSLVFSPDGKSLLTGALRFAGLPGAKLEIRKWDSETGEQLGERLEDAPDAPTVNLAFGAEHQSLVAVVGHTVLIMKLDPTAVQRRFDLPAHRAGLVGVSAVSVSRDGLLATCSVIDTAIGVWDTRTGRPQLKQGDSHTARLTTVDYSPDGSRVVTGSADGTLRLWNAASGAQVRQFEYSDGHCNLKSVAFSPNGERIAAAGNYFDAEREAIGAVKVWDATTGKLIHEFQLDEIMFDCLAFSPDGKYLAAAPAYTQVLFPRRQPEPFAAADVRAHLVEEHPVYLFPVDRGDRMRTLSGHEQRVLSLGFSADSSSVVAITHREGIHVWSLTDGSLTRSNPAPDVRSAAISSDGTFAVTASLDARGQQVTLHRWDVADAEMEPDEFGSFPSGNASVAMDISRDGTLLVVKSTGGTAALWDLRTREELARFSAPEARVYPLAFSPSGEHLLTGMDDGTAIIWKLSAAREGANAPWTEPQRGD